MLPFFQEEEELIEEWQPEPLVPATPVYDLDAINPKIVQGFVLSSLPALIILNSVLNELGKNAPFIKINTEFKVCV